jgi:large subunit ribosomal protein L5
MDRLLSLALPRIRDFRGLSARQFDGRGNYTFGLTEQVMFHEIDQQRGMDITIVTSATTNDQGKALLDAFGFPFKKGEDAGPVPTKSKRRGPQRGGRGGPAKTAAKKKK